MKKFLGILIIFFITIANVIVYADTNPSTVIQNQDNSEQEHDEILNAINNNDINPFKELKEHKEMFKDLKALDDNSLNNLKLGEPYKVIKFNNIKEEYTKFISASKMYDVLNDKTDYYYEVPILTKDDNPVSSIRVEKINGNWTITLYPTYTDPSISYLCSRPDLISSILKDNNIGNIDKFMHFSFGNYDFIYILTGNNEYFIPLNKDIGNLQLLKSYNRSTIQSIYSPIMKNVLEGSNIQTGGGGTSSIVDKNNSHYIILLMVPLLLITIYIIQSKLFKINKVKK